MANLLSKKYSQLIFYVICHNCSYRTEEESLKKALKEITEHNQKFHQGKLCARIIFSIKID